MNNNIKSPGEVLDFWFGAPDRPDVVVERQYPLWFKGGPDADAEIRRRFAATHAAAAAEALEGWAETPSGRLALVIVLDQFSRNLYRGRPEAFAQDPLALEQTMQALRRSEHLQLAPLERVFLYMPLEHDEDPASQQLCVECFEALLGAVPEAERKPFDNFLAYARQHREIVMRFGRFPHRNAILGRVDSDEEAAYLKDDAPDFGQRG